MSFQSVATQFSLSAAILVGPVCHAETTPADPKLAGWGLADHVGATAITIGLSVAGGVAMAGLGSATLDEDDHGYQGLLLSGVVAGYVAGAMAGPLVYESLVERSEGSVSGLLTGAGLGFASGALLGLAAMTLLRVEGNPTLPATEDLLGGMALFGILAVPVGAVTYYGRSTNRTVNPSAAAYNPHDGWRLGLPVPMPLKTRAGSPAVSASLLSGTF